MKLLERVDHGWHFYNLLKGFSDDLGFINSILVTLNLPQALSCNQHFIGNNVMRTAIVECFAASAKNFEGDLKDRCFNLVLYVTSREELDPELIWANPGSYVIGKFVEESYIADLRRAYEIDTKGFQ
jgi:hypothetical protein